MAVIFKQVGESAIFSADAEVRTKEGLLEVGFVETQRIPGGNLEGITQISLNSKPLVIATGSVRPKSDDGKTRRIRHEFRVYDAKKLNRVGDELAHAFREMQQELRSFEKNNPIPQVLPCFIKVPLCRLAYSQYIVACRLRGRPAQDCLREAEAIYNNCKGNC